MIRFASPTALTGGLLTLALLPMSWPGGAMAQEPDACTEEATDLIAGPQSIVVGDVNVCNDDATLTVTYEPTSPWCLLATDLHVATSESDIPQNRRGRPQPGQFDDGDDYDPCVDTDTFEIPLADIGVDRVSSGDTVVIAAHADVMNMNNGEEEGAWGDGTRFVERGLWAMYFTYTVQVPSCDRPGGSCTVFYTSAQYTGDLGGLEGADAKCNELAGDAGLAGPYRAWIADETGSPARRFDQSVVPYVLVDGTLVADNWQDLVTNGTKAAIVVSEAGDEICDPTVEPCMFFAATNPNGTYDGLGNTCAGWTDAASIGFAGIGGWDSSTQWAFGTSFCDFPTRLLCFQQGASD